jgi:hypothetical protein
MKRLGCGGNWERREQQKWDLNLNPASEYSEFVVSVILLFSANPGFPELKKNLDVGRVLKRMHF